MNGDGGEGQVIKAVLPGGTVVGVQVAAAGDGIGSVGLLDHVDLGEALATIGEIASLVRARVQPVLPTKAGVEFGISFEVRAGKLASLLVDGKGGASLKVTLEWQTQAEPGPASAG